LKKIYFVYNTWNAPGMLVQMIYEYVQMVLIRFC